MSGIYRHPDRPKVEIPDLDLLTFLFDSTHCLAEDDTVLHIAAEDPSRSLSKRELRQNAKSVAYALRSRYEVGANGKGKDVATVISSGQPLLPAAFFGVIAAGGIYSSAHSTATVEELVRQLQTSESRVLICSDDTVEVAGRAAEIAGLPRGNILLIGSTPTWALRCLDNHENLLGRGSLAWDPITDRGALERSLIVVVWSSGTTGVPKGVKLSHRNLVSQAYITHLLGRERADRQIADGTFVPYEQRSLAHLPASHIAGLFGYFISNFYAGALTVWMQKYEWRAFLRYIEKYQITQLFTVPSIWQRIAKSPDVKGQFASLRIAQSGSAPFESSLQKTASTRLRMAEGGLIAPTWGLSETTGAVTLSQSYETSEVGTVGTILPGLEVRLLDEDHRDVRDGQAGELLVRGPTVTQGYFNNDQATQDAFHQDWFQTGDIAVRKGGKLIMVDRKKELLKYKAKQIAPAELENLLCAHEGIAEAAVVGIASPEDPSSDLPRAYIVPASANLAAEEVHAYVNGRVASHKRLRGGIVFVREIRKSAIGKVLRKELQQRARRETSRVVESKL
ncbi:hypothetical protein M409DRAFT_68512 [Zasmidium cellare ATCC 36951]|uniref:AMP-dependent synthetase/ligase domain-containing protein n=1 Tax=Zasmidium cellare ATCC 36951 TaxID=1080233 RepID=A0A6A6CCH9_ZASCE|nr:uncharacterized protein M409DRAFT_68512 [Zasmidium cellare ATCC 36951]KAF2163622.1 hypothetical protein M409DRAFT_68512 [Zasmidium cellare ATCC 36951]